jgi:hypothetical protein
MNDYMDTVEVVNWLVGTEDARDGTDFGDR